MSTSENLPPPPRPKPRSASEEQATAIRFGLWLPHSDTMKNFLSFRRPKFLSDLAGVRECEGDPSVPIHFRLFNFQPLYNIPDKVIWDPATHAGPVRSTEESHRPRVWFRWQTRQELQPLLEFEKQCGNTNAVSVLKEKLEASKEIERNGFPASALDADECQVSIAKRKIENRWEAITERSEEILHGTLTAPVIKWTSPDPDLGHFIAYAQFNNLTFKKCGEFMFEFALFDEAGKCVARRLEGQCVVGADLGFAVHERY